MFKKHKFPKDWLRIPDADAKKHLRHLLDHYQDYEISAFGDDYIEIAGVGFARHLSGARNKKFLCSFPCFYVNHQKIYNESDSEIYQLCNKLFDACEQELTLRKQHNTNKISKTKYIEIEQWHIIIDSIIMMMIISLISFVKFQKQKEKTEKFLQKYEQMSHDNDVYKQTQKQIQNYHDSLRNVKTK